MPDRRVCGPECWVVAKRRGNKVRGQNRCTGAWEPDWWPEHIYHGAAKPLAGGTGGEA